MTKSDYIILGAGASGLLLAYRMANDSFFDETSIVIIDKVKDKGNDRTWCFWEEGLGEWDSILHKSWSSVYFGSDFISKQIDIKPYKYNMIRSASFYDLLWKTISEKSNISFQQAEVSGLQSIENKVVVETKSGQFEASKVFNSLLFDDSYKTQTKFPVLQQHFIGWFIKTETPQFDAEVATFMDFEIPQQGNTRFMYVLPTSKTEALFEYTLFSKELLPKAAYETAIKDYLDKKGIKDYTITETEMGSIPMTCYEFSKQNTKNILHIGTAGGWTKASTGYTFMTTTKKTKALVEFLKTEANISKFAKRTKFWYYDLLMLDVLASDNSYGAKLFSSLFKNTKVTTIFKFLDEESTLIQDLKIITSVPSWPFIKVLFKRLF
ncbi:MAG: lycopene cyclase family protein [Winogradskyella sp.]|uniref:lycopene cyclase family protein n=1 Tax=Winogradskyella sp. TaxID=1883156 RepID=UPI00385813DB